HRRAPDARGVPRPCAAEPARDAGVFRRGAPSALPAGHASPAPGESADPARSGAHAWEPGWSPGTQRGWGAGHDCDLAWLDAFVRGRADAAHPQTSGDRRVAVDALLRSYFYRGGDRADSCVARARA